MKKPGTGSTGKSGLGSIGKSGLGSFGKSGLGSTGKSSTSSGKSSGGLGLSEKPGLGSSTKSGLGSTSKSASSPTSKRGLGSTSKSASSPTTKSGLSPTSKSGGSSLKATSSSPKPSKSFDFLSSGKPTSLTPASPKSYAPYDVFGKPKSGKSSASFGIIWIPTKKRNKKKDIVLSATNDDRRIRERSPSFYKFMSGDSHDQPHKTKEEDLLVVPDRKIPTGTLVASDVPPENVAATSVDDKQQLLRHDTEDSKEAAGDTKDDDDADKDKDYLNNDEPERNNLPDPLSEKDAFGDKDKVDSVYLQPPPPHKARSAASNAEEESCGMKCLYYTLQCCDCVLM